MDWRAMSRSRSRTMDWRPTSRSRSRPPENTGFDHTTIPGVTYDGRYAFPAMVGSLPETSKFLSGRGPGLQSSMPGASMLSATRPSPPHTDLPSVYEDPSDHNAHFDPSSDSRYINHMHYSQGLSNFSSPAFAPSSLPSFGFHGAPREIPSSSNSPDQRSFPRHVRKTSFDHTVSKEGIFAGLSGRHQVNGKPLSPDSILGTKRRADAPHAESMLRADPSDVELSLLPHHSHNPSQDSDYDTVGSFPSSNFNFTFAQYDNGFDTRLSDFGRHQHQLHHQDSPQSSISGHVYSTLSSPAIANGGLTAAAAANALAETYAQLNATNLGAADDSGLDYQQLIGMVYPNLENPMQQNPYTHVDPTQILSSIQGENNFPAFHASPSSDGWGNGLQSSSNASPEPYINTSNASTPPSAESVPTGQSSRAGPSNRKYVGLKHGSADDALQRKKSLPAHHTSPKTMEPRSSTSTPDLTEQNKGDDDQTPTLCTNCSTTNTPLWRRDPSGQPLCE